MKRSRLSRSVGLGRTSTLGRRGGPSRRRPASVPGKAEAAQAFRQAVLRGPCVRCGEAAGLEAHHCVPAQVLRRICRTRDLNGPETLAIVYTPANGIALCHGCHAAHTAWFDPVPASMLPARVRACAHRLGPEALAALDRAHPNLDRATS